ALFRHRAGAAAQRGPPRPGRVLAGGRLAAPAARLRRALVLQVERHRRADESLQGGRVELVVFADVDGAADVPLEAGVEETRRVLQLGALGKRQLDDALVGL